MTSNSPGTCVANWAIPRTPYITTVKLGAQIGDSSKELIADQNCWSTQYSIAKKTPKSETKRQKNLAGFVNQFVVGILSSLPAEEGTLRLTGLLSNANGESVDLRTWRFDWKND